jgi:hypothetical protein
MVPTAALTSRQCVDDQEVSALVGDPHSGVASPLVDSRSVSKSEPMIPTTSTLAGTGESLSVLYYSDPLPPNALVCVGEHYVGTAETAANPT